MASCLKNVNQISDYTNYQCFNNRTQVDSYAFGKLTSSHTKFDNFTADKLEWPSDHKAVMVNLEFSF